MEVRLFMVVSTRDTSRGSTLMLQSLKKVTGSLKWESFLLDTNEQAFVRQVMQLL